MNDRRRPRTPAKPKPAPQLTGPVQLDDDTRNALILFNARLVAQEELEREKRRVDKATKAKDEAAAAVRRLESDPKATAEQKSEAQAAYLASLDALNRAKAGEPATGDTTEAETGADRGEHTPDGDLETDTGESETGTDDEVSVPAAEGEHDTPEADAPIVADSPDESMPGDTVSEDTKPEGTVSADTVSEDTKPDETTSAETTPDESE